MRIILNHMSMVPVYEQITGTKYCDSFFGNGTDDGYFEAMTEEAVREMSLKFCEEIRKRGLRVLWDPKVIKRV